MAILLVINVKRRYAMAIDKGAKAYLNRKKDRKKIEKKYDIVSNRPIKSANLILIDVFPDKKLLISDSV